MRHSSHLSLPSLWLYLYRLEPLISDTLMPSQGTHDLVASGGQVAEGVIAGVG